MYKCFSFSEYGDSLYKIKYKKTFISSIYKLENNLLFSTFDLSPPAIDLTWFSLFVLTFDVTKQLT